MKNSKNKLSGPAIFIYACIFVCALLAALFLSLYYALFPTIDLLQWIGIVAFMIFYHLSLRILFGEVTKRLPIDYRHPFFRQRNFEKGLYRFLRVRYWRDRVLTFDPDSFDVQKNSPESIARTMSKSEVDHWINEAISLTSILFSLLWGCFPAFFLTALLAMLFDLQFILVQRFNRPIVLRLMEHLAAREKKDRDNHTTRNDL